jgi:Natural resistance-associated macrophage protein
LTATLTNSLRGFDRRRRSPVLSLLDVMWPDRGGQGCAPRTRRRTGRKARRVCGCWRLSLAGAFTFALFAAGIIGIGLLAVPVLAGSGAYALGAAFGWPTGLDRKPLDAKAFYGTIAMFTLIGIFINFVRLDPIRALFCWSGSHAGRRSAFAMIPGD